jgi:hypothetical protein
VLRYLAEDLAKELFTARWILRALSLADDRPAALIPMTAVRRGGRRIRPRLSMKPSRQPILSELELRTTLSTCAP